MLALEDLVAVLYPAYVADRSLLALMEFSGEGLISVESSKDCHLFRLASPRSDLLRHQSHINLRNLLAIHSLWCDDLLRSVCRVPSATWAFAVNHVKDGLSGHLWKRLRVHPTSQVGLPAKKGYCYFETPINVSAEPNFIKESGHSLARPQGVDRLLSITQPIAYHIV